MELQFNKTVLSCLKQLAWEQAEQEATQEIKLSDSMPDVGRILAAWGQLLIRGKEWNKGEISVSGAVMVSVLYAPEDGSEPRCAESWIPVQMKWSIPESKTDGAIIASGTLINLDARTISSRKILARVNVGMQIQVLMPDETDIYAPGELPEDIQILQKNYPLKIPKEAGEKVFLLDEELTLPGSAPDIHKILRYSMIADLIDQKVMAGKVVFRGAAIVHVLYCTEDGKLASVDVEMPFSQYKDLEHEYELDADAKVTIALTSLELEQGEGDSLYLKAGMVGQYVVFDRPVITVAEDAYSTQRPLALSTVPLDLPTVLDMRKETMHATAEMEASGIRELVDTAFLLGQPATDRKPDSGQMGIGGRFQVMYYNEEGVLETAAERWKVEWEVPVDNSGIMNGSARITGKTQGNVRLDGVSVRSDVLAEMEILGTQGIPMVTAIVVEEKRQADPNRPSLILRCVGEEDLWHIAKNCGSTVDAIRKANGLESDPEYGRMLLIPIA